MMEQEYKYMVCTRCFTFNHAPYIVDAMNGFTMQETTFPVITLIVDDASQDGEPDVIRQYLVENFQAPYSTEETDDYYLICANHTTNPNCTFVVFLLKYNHYSIRKDKMPYLSKWLDNAKYISLCEGDDYWTDSSKLQKQVDFLEAHQDYSMCFHGSVIKCEGKGYAENRKHQFDGLETREYKGEELIKKWIIPTASMVYRSYIVPPRDTRFLVGDLILRNQCTIEGKVFCFSENMAVYRIHDGGMTTISPWKSIEKQLNHLEALIEHFPQYSPFYLQIIKKSLRQSLLSRNAMRTILMILKKPRIIRYLF